MKGKFREEDFTLKLALFDAVPVLFFLGSMLTISMHFHSMLFSIGASCSLIAGFSKVLWKIVMGLKRGNLTWLSNLFIPFQIFGFTFMIASLIIDRRFIHLRKTWEAVSGFPTSLFLIIGFIGMCIMIGMSFHFDQSVKSHWKAQCVNAVAQACILIGLLFI